MSLLSAVLQTAVAVEINDHRTLCANLCPQLRELTDRARTLGCLLRERLVESHVHYSATFAQYNLEYSRRAAKLQADYERQIAEARTLASKPESPGDCTAELKTCIEDVERAYGILSSLRAAEEASESLAHAGVEFERLDYAAAVARLDGAVETLAALRLEGDAAVAVRNIRSAANGRRALYLTRLGREWEEMLSWSERSGASHVTYSLLVRQGDARRLHALLQSLHRVRRLHDELAQFADFFITRIVKRIVDRTCDIYTDENVDTIIFSIKFERTDGRRPSFQSIFTNLTAVLEFLQSAMGVTFTDGSTLISVLAQLVSDRFFDLLITDCIKTYLPDCDDSYQQYKRLASELDSFNKFLIDIKFITKDSSPLEKYLNDANGILYKKKCDKLLNQVRRLLTESISHLTVTVSGESTEADVSQLNITEQYRDTVNRPLMLPRCVVSENVRSILALITTHLSDGCKLPEQYSLQLVRYIGDIVFMYQTLVPSINEVSLRENPLDIALFFNNSFYLAHGLLGSPWSLSLPANLADALNTTLAPALTDIRTLGLHYLSHYLRRQKNFILDTVHPAERVMWNYDSYEHFDKAVASSMKTMRTLKAKWEDVMPTTMYDKSMSTLVEAFCQAILNKIFSTQNKHVEEDLILMMSTRIEALVEEIKALFKDATDLSLTVSTWKKFSKMPVVLTAEMVEMTTLWDGGVGSLAQVYTCEEIRHIVKIRFPDDAHRLKILAAIQ